MENLIEKYLQNNLTQKEAEKLRKWLEHDPVNRAVFENIVGQWKISNEDITVAKQKVLERVRQTEKVTLPIHTTASVWRYILAIAATLVIGFSITFLIYKFNYSNRDQPIAIQEMIEKEAMRGQKISFELPDGSKVKLNAGSKLLYPATFASTKREVTLVGEAFFEVTHDTERPFKIAAGNIHVQVLGTSFNVRSYPEDAITSVAVKTGKVAVSHNDNKILLLPKEMVNYYSDEKQMKREAWTSDLAAYGWTEKNISFENLEFEEIVKILSRWYAVDFTLEAQLDSRKRFTAHYKDPSLNTVLESLSYIYEFDYELKKEQVIIK